MTELHNLESVKAALERRGYVYQGDERMPGFAEWLSPSIEDGSPLITAPHSIMLEAPCVMQVQLIAQELRREGLSYKRIREQLAERGYFAEIDKPYGEYAVKKMVDAHRIMMLRDEGSADHALPLAPRLIQALFADAR